MRRLVWAFAGRTYDIVGNLMSRLIYDYTEELLDADILKINAEDLCDMYILQFKLQDMYQTNCTHFFFLVTGGCTGPLQKLFHYAIFQKFFHFYYRYINGLWFTIQVIKFSLQFVSINHNNV